MPAMQDRAGDWWLGEAANSLLLQSTIHSPETCSVEADSGEMAASQTKNWREAKERTVSLDLAWTEVAQARSMRTLKCRTRIVCPTRFGYDSGASVQTTKTSVGLELCQQIRDADCGCRACRSGRSAKLNQKPLLLDARGDVRPSRRVETNRERFVNRQQLVSVAALILAGFATHSAMGQDASVPKSRADVKNETRAAEKAGQIPAASEAADPSVSGSSPSSKTRGQRKAETRAAARSKQLAPAGESAAPLEPKATSTSTTSRAERKAETRAAAKAKQLSPAGEGSDAPKK